MLIDEGNIHNKIGPLSQLATEKITFPLKPDRQTYRRTDISAYRVASLLKKNNRETNHCNKCITLKLPFFSYCVFIQKLYPCSVNTFQDFKCFNFMVVKERDVV